MTACPGNTFYTPNERYFPIFIALRLSSGIRVLVTKTLFLFFLFLCFGGGRPILRSPLFFLLDAEGLRVFPNSFLFFSPF